MKSVFVILICPWLFVQCQDKDVEMAYRELTVTEKKLVQSGNNFGFKFFKKMNEANTDKNVFLSPLSVSVALGMTLNGAREQTFDAMRSTLEFEGLMQEEINGSYLSLIRLLQGLDKKVVFEIANSIWYRNELNVQKKFIDDNEKNFDAEIAAMDFTDPGSIKRINQWVSDKTHDKIQRIVDSLDPNLVMLLINAIYFKGTWTYEFDKSKTFDDAFTSSDGTKTPCRMMTQEGDFSYLNSELFQAVDLPYGNGEFSMLILLPNSGVSVNNLIATLDQAKLNTITENLRITSGTVEMPKFKQELKYTLNDILAAMGMGVAFTPGAADFSGIDSNIGKYLFISDVTHKTFVEVNEEGTEAAAVTSVGISVTSVGGGGFYFRADHPFVFLIKENRSQTVLFVGKLAKM
jgi:serpin B